MATLFPNLVGPGNVHAVACQQTCPKKNLFSGAQLVLAALYLLIERKTAKKGDVMDKNPIDNFVHHLFPLAKRVEFEPFSDKQLLQRYTEHGDEPSFGEVVRRHGAMVWSICQRILGQRQDAEDAYQVTFLKLVRQATFVQRYESAEGWLHTVAHNVAINAKLKRDRERVREKKRAEMQEESYTESRDASTLAAILDEEVNYLPEKLRIPIILCYIEGLTHEEAAQRINISTYCLRRRLTEGRQRLQQRLSKKPASGDKG